MKIIFTFFILLFTISTTIIAQVDQVSIGLGYSLQTFYSLATGESKTLTNESWDIAFSAAGQQDAGIFINESVTFMSNPIQIFLSPSDDWSEVITTTDIYVDSVALYNPKLNWTEGALNSIKNPNSPFDFGWGSYNPQTNIVEGDKIFVVKKRNGSFIKLQITQLAGGEYTFNYANLDGSNEQSAIVNKSQANGGLVYFSFNSNSTIEAPSSYDLIFQRYSIPLDDGEGGIINYVVTGILLAAGTEAVIAKEVDPGAINESDYSDLYSSIPTTIGHDWKTFDFQSGWIIDFERTQFIKTAEGDIYQVTIFDFEGSSTGTTTLEKTLITSVSTLETSEESSFNFSPNPASDFFQIQQDQHNPLKVSIINNTGDRLQEINTHTNTPIQISHLPSGIYHIIVMQGESYSSKRLVVK